MELSFSTINIKKKMAFYHIKKSSSSLLLLILVLCNEQDIHNYFLQLSKQPANRKADKSLCLTMDKLNPYHLP